MPLKKTQLKKKNQKIIMDDQTRILVILTSVVVALVVCFIFLVPTLQNQCLLGNKNCITVSYQQLGDELLVESQSGGRYWYDGDMYVVDYTDNPPGVTCKGSSIGTQETPQMVPVKDAVHVDKRCLKYNEENECIKWSNEPSWQPQEFPGEDITPAENYRAAFTFNAKTMQLIPQQVTCVPLTSVLVQRFRDAPRHTLKVRVIKGKTYLNIYELFDVLRNKKIL